MKPFSISALVFFFSAIFYNSAFAQSINIPGPAGSSVFGTGITVLSNGNFVVTDPEFNGGYGAVYLYNGSTHQLISTLKGENANCHIGSGGITVLPNGNYLVKSPQWNDGATPSFTGAVTWCNANTGIAGTVNINNSIVGYGFAGEDASITILRNGNYVLSCNTWGPMYSQVGAATWCNGNGGTIGAVSSSNSLVGSTSNGQVASNGVTALANGNYVVANNSFGGSIQWCNGNTGATGVVNSSNSLITNTANSRVSVLTNGNYVVISEAWSDGINPNVGAVTWCDGSIGRTGTISTTNSLTGICAPNLQLVGLYPLANGNYIVTAPLWNNAGIQQAGAVIWCDGAIGRTGTITTANAVVGTTSNDRVGSDGILALPNGNYVIGSPNWSGVGAATWCDGTVGRIGIINSTNSLVGSTAADAVGSLGDVYTNPKERILANGNYIISSPNWNNGTIADVGAVTWCNGNIGTSGVVSNINSLVGSKANDQVGYSFTTLSNGNYVVCSPFWDNGSTVNTGAVTWCNGSTGIVGIVSTTNSIIGAMTENKIGTAATALLNGNYVISSMHWDNGSITDAGAATWCNGNMATSGTVNSGNSIVGSKTNDWISYNDVSAANVITSPDGNYMLVSAYWDNGSMVNAGAVTYGNGSISAHGTITTCNSVLGNIANEGYNLTGIYNDVYDYMIVGISNANKITLFYPSGLTLANHLDNINTNIAGNSKVPLIANAGCRIIASLKPEGTQPVFGTLNAKAWIESAVPYYQGFPFVQRHIEVLPAANEATASGKLTLYFTQQEFNDFNNDPGSTLNLPTNPNDAAGIANLRVGRFISASTDGSGLPSSYITPETLIDPNDQNIIWNSDFNRWEVTFNTIGFGGFIIQTNLSVLPLQLLSFTGRLQKTDAVLTWKTANEQSTQNFEIERSINGTNYFSIGSVVAANNQQSHFYNFIDTEISSLHAAVVYYRLKMLDINGRFTYSSVVALPFKDKNVFSINPNPATNETTLSIYTDNAQMIQVSIFDNAGRLMQKDQYNVQKGKSTVLLPLNKLTAGLYHIQIAGLDIHQNKRLIKQ